ncbi:hypothetical protein F4805DRAFT_435774 [Annulohypoxylon moriforme]|nr:hypothetical protein F4805DRAFT_435774 [Annulohypoxylon moriforme]
MADPVGVAGTAVGIVSLCLQVYSSLSSYLDDFKDRDQYVNQVLSYLGRLRNSIAIIESAVPDFQNGHPIPSQAITDCIQDCEIKLNTLRIEICKYQPVPSKDLKGKFKDAKRKLQFPFNRPELEKLAEHLNQMNGLLSTAIGALNLHLQSDNRDKLIQLGISSRATRSELTIIHNKLNQIDSKGDNLEVNSKNNQADLDSMSQNIHKLSLISPEIHSSASKITEIQTDTSSNTILLHELFASQQRNESQLEELITAVQSIHQSNQISPTETILQMLMSKPSLLKDYQDKLAAINPESIVTTPGQGTSRTGSKYNPAISGCACHHRRQISQWSFKWHFFRRFDKSIVTLRHERGCPKYRNSQIEKKQTIGIVCTGLYQIFRIAIEVSLVLNTGAGGRSIAPTFQYYAVVDENQSSAFRIIETMYYFVQVRCTELDITNQEKELACQQIIRFGISRLQRVFAAGFSQPTDISIRGETLIGMLFNEYHRHIAFSSLDTLHTIILGLLNSDVPIMSTAALAYPVLNSCLDLSRLPRIDVDFITNRLAPLIIQNQPETHICSINDSNPLETPAFQRCFFETKGITEAFGFDSPLFETLHQRDELSLKRILPSLGKSPDLFCVKWVPSTPYRSPLAKRISYYPGFSARLRFGF